MSEDLPYCASCLHDFSPSQAPCAFSCGHLYCFCCLQRLRDGQGAYKCLFDGGLSAEGSVLCDIELGQALEKARTGQEVSMEVINRGNTGDLSQVTCRVAFQGTTCPRADDCPFSHAAKSIRISQRFLVTGPAPCWECQNCLLTISFTLGKCPVCDCDREEQLKGLQSRPSIREMKSGTNVTLDQSVVTEEERPRVKQTPISPLSEQITPIEETLKQEEPARSKCCALQ